MNTNKILLSALAGGVAYFFLGWLVYGILLQGMMEMPAAIAKEPMEMWAMAISCLVYGLLLAVIFGHWASISTLMTGAKAGAIIGALVAAYVDFSFFSMYNFITLQSVIVDIIAATALSAITGGVVGWVLGYKKA
ncbi:MAG: hypothetical protein DHS20C18_52940 [Saprospiraceae bacterium]|nr:MAG: hypothetical protein DHS20C18_52940 [Saprospiraceae bacterium]